MTGLPISTGNANPTHIQEYDGFDVTTLNTKRWKTPVIVGSTAIEQTGGELVLSNNGAGTAGKSYYESIRKFGKNWRVTVDMKIALMTGSSGELSLVLYVDATHYIKIGPYKTSGGINSNCYMRYKNGGIEVGMTLTSEVINTTEYNNYTFAVIHNTVVVYYRGIKITSMPFDEIHNFSVRIEGGTGSNTDTFTGKANDYEIINHFNMLEMTTGATIKNIHDDLEAVGGLVQDIIDALPGIGVIDPAMMGTIDDIYDIVDDIHDTMGSSVVTNIAGNITLTNTTEYFLTFTKAIYGNKFVINLFADLEGTKIDYVALSPAGGAWVDYTATANNLKSNSIPLSSSPAPIVADTIYFASLVNFKRLDIYMEGGTSNNSNTYAWEYWNGATWVELSSISDGTLYGGFVFGKSGSVTFTETIVKQGSYYMIRATMTVAGTSTPKATHIQISNDGATGFDSRAAFLSNLLAKIYRKRGDGNYASLPADMALPFTQCIIYRNLEINDVKAWQDVKIGFKLSETPTAQITIPYTGYVETIEPFA